MKKQKKIQTWNKKMSLGLSLAGIMAVITILLTPMVGAGGGTSTVSGTVVVNNACSFTENVAGVQYGGAAGLTPYPSAANTLANSNSIAVTNTGDANSNILINGASTTWASGGNNFYVENTVYSSNSAANLNYFVYPANTWSATNAANGNEIAMTGVQEDTMIPVNTVSANSFYTGLRVPASQAGGTYTLTIDIVSSC